ncbi:hypothetical protein PtrEW4_011748 [Pyrenophora tritici-repentis]|uniref:Uncharacterized protein n=1 Tax=Pyrenophora tritici-repentis TaxID=45151 RepID=A0A922N5E9_9PLEO|nr:hypothetical protein Ptr86124_012958 [Pyrenophora tritici-repentis]KAI1559227.1 hypothetical protein PtrEW7m1_011961 [Pyrenophora tritici-repentis]KAI1559412.1 hypothetical protein PtrEW4_011748 [Pyrenophora tritici-repentis]KAI1690391.1 hypothetical protein KJE20_03569 [Pyrenophora tritici-repentis]
MEDYTGFIDQELQSFDTDDICDPTWLASVNADIDNYVAMIYSHDGNLQVENSTNESVIALSTISTVLDIPPYTQATNPSSEIEAAQTLLGISAASAPPTLAMSNIFTTFQAAPEAVIAPSSAMIGESISHGIPYSATIQVTSEPTATSAPGGHALADVTASDVETTVGRQDASESPKCALGQLSVATDNSLTGRASVSELSKDLCDTALPNEEDLLSEPLSEQAGAVSLEEKKIQSIQSAVLDMEHPQPHTNDYTGSSVPTKNATNNTEDARSSISIKNREKKNLPEIRIKQTTHQGSRMSVPAVSPAQVGTREAPILIDDVMDEDINQHDADGEFDLLIYAFGGDTEQDEDEEDEDDEEEEGEEGEAEEEDDEEDEDDEDEEEDVQEQTRAADTSAEGSYSEGASYSPGPERGGRLSLRRSPPKAQRLGMIDWREAIEKRIDQVEKTWSTVQALWIELYSVPQIRASKSMRSFQKKMCTAETQFQRHSISREKVRHLRRAWQVVFSMARCQMDKNDVGKRVKQFGKRLDLLYSWSRGLRDQDPMMMGNIGDDDEGDMDWTP